ncbi:unnamed protein product [Durusdinium trenchii]|uniref:Tubulin-tyrosine ligase family protein n=1 Tax=Durusdinium trenchii TaxID=1381693 RepID=A0ABP0P1D8_9DINO
MGSLGRVETATGEMAYVLPPTEEMYNVMLHGLKSFTDDLQSGHTDSSAIGYGWAPAPFAAKISAPRFLRPKPPTLSLSLRDAELRPAPLSARSPGAEGSRSPRRPSSAGMEAAARTTSDSDTSRGGAAKEIVAPQSARGVVLPPAKSSRQRPQKHLAADGKGPKKPVTKEPRESVPMPPERVPQDRHRPAPMRPVPNAHAQNERATGLAAKHGPRNLEEHIAFASQRLLSGQLTWKTEDSFADYRNLRAGEYFNHFQQNAALTTKAGLTKSLKDYSTSFSDAESFFPRSYDVAQKSEREDFILDFRRSAALRVALLHRRMRKDQQQGLNVAYQCNETVLAASQRVLQRWQKDLDREHLDEGDEGAHLSEDLWEALLLYSDLQQSELLYGVADRNRHAKNARSEESCVQELKLWPEFLSHHWGYGEFADTLQHTLMRLEMLFPQWSLLGNETGGRNVWIVKPGTNSKSNGIECMSHLKELLQHCDRMPNRLVQKYVERPLLLFSGRKFDIRQWVLVRSVEPLKVFLFSECYLRLCNGMYDLGDLRDRERHISSWQVNKHGKNVVDGAVVSLEDFRRELEELTGQKDYWEKELLPQMKHIVVEVLRAGALSLTPRAESFELFGFDLMLDEAMKMWLLEVNLSPGCDSRTWPYWAEKKPMGSERLRHRDTVAPVATGTVLTGTVTSDQAQRAAGVMRCERPDLSIQGTPLGVPVMSQRVEIWDPGGRGVSFIAEDAEASHSPKEPVWSQVRKGTGFVSLSDLPDDDEEEQGVRFPEANGFRTIRPEVRKGTGFVAASDLPSDGSDDEDDAATAVRKGTGYVSLSDLPSDGEEVRKGTGFVSLSELPSDGSEEEAQMVRKGTGYVSLSELPSDDEEDSYQASGQEGQPRTKVRKGTGYVAASDLPSDGSDEERGVSFNVPSKAEGHTGDPKGKVRKGTGYVSLSELPSDDEEDSYQASGQEGQPRTKVRKGTGYVAASDLPSDGSDEEKQYHLQERGVTFNVPSKAEGHTGDPKGKVRKGTGYVSLSELPSDDEEDTYQQASGQEGQPRTKVRKGTGYVAASDLPSDGSDEERGVTFNVPSKAEGHTGDPKGKVRKGTGYVSLSELPSDDEEEPASVSFQASGPEGQLRPKVRKGTGFVAAGDLPSEGSEEEQETNSVSFKARADQGDPKPKVQQGTGFVGLSDLPDEESSVSFQARGDEGEPKPKVRQDTCVVRASQLPPEEEEEQQNRWPRKSAMKQQVSPRKQGHTLSAYALFELGSDEEDEGENEAQVTTATTAPGRVGFDETAEEKPRPTASKVTGRRGTGFISAEEVDNMVPDEEAVVRETAKATLKKGRSFVATEDLAAALEEPESPGLQQADHAEVDAESRVTFDASAQERSSSQGSSKVARKGTGFLSANDLKNMADEDEAEDPKAAVTFDESAQERASSQGSSKVARKGTGFLSAADLQAMAAEEEDEAEASKAAVTFDESAEERASSQGSSKVARKGTGFLSAADLQAMAAEEEDEAEDPKAAVTFDESAQERASSQGSSKVARKGTGFLSAADLQAMAAEEEDEAEDPKAAVTFDESAEERASSQGSSKVARKGTGFLSAADLQAMAAEEEDEAEDPKAAVTFDESAEERASSQGSSKVARKGTGFLSAADLQAMAAEEEDEAEDPKAAVTFDESAQERASSQGSSKVDPKAAVTFDETAQERSSSQGSSKVGRKGTGFLSANDLKAMGNEDEAEDEDEEHRGAAVTFDESAQAHGIALQRCLPFLRSERRPKEAPRSLAKAPVFFLLKT